jgi:creatinine amidohydrolase
MPKADEDRKGYSIFHGSMADMTWPEVEAAARAGAIALWALGVIEEHGPHLPLATDVYLPSATLARVRQILEARGQPAVIVPAFYWGVNTVTAGFPGSITVRPETMIELMVDVFQSLRRDGFETAFCLSGHGDAEHNLTIAAAVKQGRQRTGIRAFALLPEWMAGRLPLDTSERHLAVFEEELPRTAHFDVHAGYVETSLMWGLFPDIVRGEVVPTLKSTDLGLDDLLEWREGWSNARRKTPLGYFGDPASADPQAGRELLESQATRVADCILARLASGCL